MCLKPSSCRPAKLLRPSVYPSGFVTLKTKLVLEKQRRDPSLVGRHQVGRPEPEGQWGPSWSPMSGTLGDDRRRTASVLVPPARNRDRARIGGTCSPRTSGTRPGTLGRPLRWRTKEYL